MADLESFQPVEIRCNPALVDKKEDLEKIVNNLSGVVFSHNGKYLWAGTDEFTAIERFTRIDSSSGVFGDQKRFHFRDFIDSFDDRQGEVDVEGLDYSDGYLWVIGSHSSKRKKAKIKSDKFKVEDQELKQVEREENRYLLARIPVNEAGELEQESSQRAWLKREGSSNSLTKALTTDEYLNLGQIIDRDERGSLAGQEFYFNLPSKENGLDIEGLAVKGNKIAIGLRGPVLRGIAILLEIEVEEGTSHELNLKPIGNDGRQYKRHFLDLNGLGIRELCWEKNGKRLLILTGPTMDLDGSHSLFHLDNPFKLPDNSLSSQKNGQLKYLGDIPHGLKEDRAEGLTLDEGGRSILVVYDSPTQKRLIRDDGNIIGVRADIFALDS
jgi:Protein of unknown function (DUF3616)